MRNINKMQLPVKTTQNYVQSRNKAWPFVQEGLALKETPLLYTRENENAALFYAHDMFGFLRLFFLITHTGSTLPFCIPQSHLS